MKRWVLAMAFLLVAAGAQSQDIVLGNSLPLTGPLESAGKAGLGGIRAYLARVDREGGVGGRKVVLRSLDDGYDAARYAANVRELLQKDGVQALLLSAGTSNIDAAYPVIEQSGKPLIGALTGAGVLRTAQRPLIFHLRASYADEVQRLAQQAVSVSQKRVYAIWQDDGLGRDAFAALQKAVQENKLELAGSQGVQIAKLDGPALGKAVRDAKPDALFLLCVTPCAAAVLSNTARAGVVGISTYALSIVNGESLVKAVGPAARGTVISQVLPDPHHPTSALVRQYQQDVRQLTGRDDFSYFSLEGYVSAMAAVEAARIAGPKGTIADGMRQLMRRDLLGIPVSGGGVAGTRPHPVQLTLIGADGRLLN